VFPQSFRDLTLVAGTIGDYAALVVPADSPIEDMAGLLAAYSSRAWTSPSAAARCPAAWTTSWPRW
jgi:tripartite-type tricarboxylate transporter receptor subunit TctC